MLKLFFLETLLTFSVLGGQTTVFFQPGSTTVGPFPTNALTASDPTQRTGLLVQLPLAADTCDASSAPGVCSNRALLNQLDGFSVNPRVMVCFSAPVDPGTLRSGISILPAGGGPAISVNQVIYDSASKCAFAKPNQVLNQQKQYLLLVSNAVRDTGGQPVAPNPAYLNCPAILPANPGYCVSLAVAVATSVKPPALFNLVAASLFTTMSATTWMEQVHDSVSQGLPVPAATAATFPLSTLQSMRWIPQDNSGTALHEADIPLAALSGVGDITFGAFFSPDYLFPLDGTIHTTATGLPPAAPYFTAPVSFHIFRPATARPKNGYPVVIYGHGLGDNQFGAPTYIASTLAKNGFATLGFEVTGHGYGPGGVVKVTDTNGHVQTVPTPGRGILLPGNTQIGALDGCAVPGAVAVRDCGRQTAIDLFALVKAIRSTPSLNLDATRIYYVGQSFGGTYGTMFHAVEPSVTAAVLNGAGGTSVDIARLAITARPLAVGFLAPLGLLNVPPADFNDNYVFRDTAPVVTNVPGAMAIQGAFEAADWLGMSGDALSYAPHLEKSQRLANVPAKKTLFQVGEGDLEVPNPTESAVVRAAGAQDSSWFFLMSQAVATRPELAAVTMPDVAPLPILPHRILANPTIFDYPAEYSIAHAEQQQAATYFQSNGSSSPDPNKLVLPPFSRAMQLFISPVPGSGQ